MFISAGILIQAFGDELNFVQAEVNIQGTVVVFWYVHTDFIFHPYMLPLGIQKQLLIRTICMQYTEHFNKKLLDVNSPFIFSEAENKVNF